jgi:hypothetical protein
LRAPQSVDAVSTVDVQQHDVASWEDIIARTDARARKVATAADRPSRFDRAGDDDQSPTPLPFVCISKNPR